MQNNSISIFSVMIITAIISSIKKVMFSVQSVTQQIYGKYSSPIFMKLGESL